MRRLITAAALLVLGAIALRGPNANAVRPCDPVDEALGFRSPSSASFNGQAAVPTATSSYTTDAGVEFFLSHFAYAQALPNVGSTECKGQAQQLTLRFSDPWTGEERTMGLAVTP